MIEKIDNYKYSILKNKRSLKQRRGFLVPNSGVISSYPKNVKKYFEKSLYTIIKFFKI